MNPRRGFLSILSSSVLLLGALTAAQAPLKSTNDGVYAAGQGDRGKAAFQARCTACHESSQFASREFISGWSKEPLSSLYEMIAGTMPADNPGGLPPQEYADVVAYFLQLNGYPAGAEELKAGKEAMSTIRLDPPETR
jgi:mono/diheme cytochrome c family protein